MERMFPGSYGVNPEDREHALQIGIFSIDANVLCDLWRYSPETRDLLLNTMELLSQQGRLWIANQAVTELHRRRLKVIGDQRQRALDIIQFFGDFVKAVKGAVKNDRHHPTLQLEKLEAIAIDANKKATTLWNEAKQNAINPYDDPILRRLTTIVGEGFGHDPVDDLNAAKEAALQRIAARVPPGYMDDGKDDGGIGDVLIWMELLLLGKTRQLPIVFVTSDGKEDWWEKMKDDSGEKRIGPRHELVAEMQHQAGVIYVQMDPEELQRYGDTVLHIETPEEVFEELREVSQEPEPEPLRYVPNPPPDWMIPSHHAATTIPDDFAILTNLGASVSGPMLKAMMAQQERASQTTELVRMFRDRQAADLASTVDITRRAMEEATRVPSMSEFTRINYRGYVEPDPAAYVNVDPAAHVSRPIDAVVGPDVSALAGENVLRTIQSAEVMIDPGAIEPKRGKKKK